MTAAAAQDHQHALHDRRDGVDVAGAISRLAEVAQARGRGRGPGPSISLQDAADVVHALQTGCAYTALYTLCPDSIESISRVASAAALTPSQVRL